MRRSIATVGAVVLGLVALTPGASPAAPVQTDPGLSPADQASVDAGLPVADKAEPGAKPAGANPFLALLPDAGQGRLQRLGDVHGEAGRGEGRGPAQGARGRRRRPPAAAAAGRGRRGRAGRHPRLQRGPGVRPADHGLRHRPRARTRRSACSARSTPRRSRRPPVPPPPEDDGVDPAGRGHRHRRRPAAASSPAPRSATARTARPAPAPTTSTSTSCSATAGRGGDACRRPPRPARWTRWSRSTRRTARSSRPTTTAAARFDSLLRLHGAGRRHVLRGRRGVQRAAGRPVRPGQRRRRRRARARTTVTIAAASDDQDFFAVKLRAGDVLGATVKGSAAYLTVYDTDPREVHGSDQDATLHLPDGLAAARRRQRGHRLRGDQGRLALRRRGQRLRRYDITVEAYRPVLQGDHAGADAVPGLRRRPGQHRRSSAAPGNVTLSPFSAFLAKWGITARPRRTR